MADLQDLHEFLKVYAQGYKDGAVDRYPSREQLREVGEEYIRKDIDLRGKSWNIIHGNLTALIEDIHNRERAREEGWGCR